MTHALTSSELHRLEITERVASCFSLAGTSFIFFTFLYSPAFRKPVNRLIFYASWGYVAFPLLYYEPLSHTHGVTGNAVTPFIIQLDPTPRAISMPNTDPNSFARNTLCNVATLMSQSGVRAGKDSHLCQFQGFLIQMFLPADALWNLAMAINVYMTLFRQYNSSQLKALEWRYHLMCYGAPFLIALIYIFIETPSQGKIYGPATLWCWIDIKWVALRIALCYAPAWCCILASLCIYILAGREIFAKRSQLRAFNNPTRPVPVQIENPFVSFKTTEILITSELATLHTPNVTNIFMMPDNKRAGVAGKGYDQYSVTIDSAPKSPRSEAPPPPMTSRTHSTIAQQNSRAAMEANRAAFGYTKVALLFFVSLLVTWVPSSINRAYSLVHPSLVSLPFTYASGIVLPLMGFWNSVIYITTSWATVRLLLSGRLNVKTPTLKQSSTGFNSRPSLGVKKWTGMEDESVKGLAVGRGSGYDQV